MIHSTAEVSEQVKFPPRNMIVQLSTPFSDTLSPQSPTRKISSSAITMVSMLHGYYFSATAVLPDAMSAIFLNFSRLGYVLLQNIASYIHYLYLKHFPSFQMSDAVG